MSLRHGIQCCEVTGHKETVELLLKRKASPFLEDKKGEHALAKCTDDEIKCAPQLQQHPLHVWLRSIVVCYSVVAAPQVRDRAIAACRSLVQAAMDAEAQSTQFSNAQKRGRGAAAGTLVAAADGGDDDEDDGIALKKKPAPRPAAAKPPVAGGRPAPAVGRPAPAVGAPAPAVGRPEVAAGRPAAAVGAPAPAPPEAEVPPPAALEDAGAAVDLRVDSDEAADAAHGDGGDGSAVAPGEMQAMRKPSARPAVASGPGGRPAPAGGPR